MVGKIKLSPGQGLLILLKHYWDDPAFDIERLKTLYLCGAQDLDSRHEIKRLLCDPLLSSYEISFDAHIISNDPTRRYFETHLAYQTLKNGLSSIGLDDLEAFLDAIKLMLGKHAQYKGHNVDILPDIYEATVDDFSEIDRKIDLIRQRHDMVIFPESSKEFYYYIKRLNSGAIFSELTVEQRKQIKILVQIAFLSTVIASINVVPFNIYGRGPFIKELIIPRQASSLRSQNLGIMQRDMPVAHYDDIARSEETQLELRPADRSTYNQRTNLVRDHFNHLVHPFVNSISGTMLGQLRTLIGFKDHVDITANVVNRDGYFKEVETRTLCNTYVLSLRNHTLLYVDDDNNEITLINDPTKFDAFYKNLCQRYSADNFAYARTIEIDQKDIAQCITSVCGHVHPALAQAYHCPFLESSEKLSNFLSFIACSVLFFGGGHSFFEFLSPVFLDETKIMFTDIPGFQEINMQSLLQTNNRVALDDALEKTMQYNKIMVFKRSLPIQLTAANDLKENTKQLIDALTAILSEDVSCNLSLMLFKQPSMNKEVKKIIRLLDDDLPEALAAIVKLRESLVGQSELYQNVIAIEKMAIQLYFDTPKSPKMSE